MKATYRRVDTDARRTNIILIGIIVCAFIVLLTPPVRGAISRGVYSTAPELWSLGNTAINGVSSFIQAFRTKETLVSENVSLKEELSALQARVLDRNLLADRVVELEEMVNRAPVDDHVAGFVLAGPRATPYDVIIIDVGSDVGVAVGDSVVYTGSGIVGTISEVFPDSSKVKLTSSPGSEVPVLLGGDMIPVTATGRGMGNFEVTIPTGSSLVVGDLVLLPPGNLIVGAIGALETSPTEPVVRVLFRTSFNIEAIRSVEVLVGRHHE